MALRRTFSVIGLVFASALAVGCSASQGSAEGPTVTLAGQLGGGTVKTQGFGGVTLGSGGVHVAARKLHRRGEPGGSVDVLVGPDGAFRLDIARGARYVVTVDGDDGESALLTFGDGESALDVSADGDSATVRVGNVRVTGGEAKTDVIIDGRLGLASTIAALDEVFEAADGAVLAAREAAEQAKRAAEEARAAAEDAQDAAEEARRAAEQAANLGQ